MSEERIEVTQADREAAADFMFECRSHNYSTPHRLAVREGKRDDTVTVQAFARHRIRASRPAPTGLVEDVIVLLRSASSTEDAAAKVVAHFAALKDRDVVLEEAGRFITIWRKTGEECLDWDFYVSENETELRQVLANLKKQNIRQDSTYRLGEQVTSLAALKERV